MYIDGRMASQTATMSQPWVLDAYHDMMAASLVTTPHATPTAGPPLHPHHLMGSPLTSTIPLTSPIASPLSPAALPIGSPMLTPIGNGDSLTSIPPWGAWDTLVASSATLPTAQIPCHPDAFYFLDPAWFG